MSKIYQIIYTTLISTLIIASCTNEKNNRSIARKRLISLSPHITEIIYALGAQNELVAVTDYCKFPEEAIGKEKIGGLVNPNIEKIISLKPSHLFGVPAHDKLNQELEKFGLEVTRLQNENISDITNCIRKIGSIINRDSVAENLVKEISNSLDLIKFKNGQYKTVSAMLIIGREKGNLRNITVSGSNTFINEMWSHVGGINTFSDLPARYNQVNLESVIARNPDVIIEFGVEGKHSVQKQRISSEWEILKDVKAVQNNNIYTISGSHTLIPGPRLVLLANDFKKVIQDLNEDL